MNILPLIILGVAILFLLAIFPIYHFQTFPMIVGLSMRNLLLKLKETQEMATSM